MTAATPGIGYHHQAYPSICYFTRVRNNKDKKKKKKNPVKDEKNRREKREQKKTICKSFPCYASEKLLHTRKLTQPL
jgi:hypothetical protein